MKKIAIIVSCLTLPISLVKAFADTETKCLQDTQANKVYVQDIGVMGLASHDLFAWNHKTKSNRENGRLDLSTLFDSDLKGNIQSQALWWKNKRIQKGGNRKNSENAPVFTVAGLLLQNFNEMQRTCVASNALEFCSHESRKTLVVKWHQMVRESFERLTQLSWPQPRHSDEKVNNQEQAAMRILHDILPGQIKRGDGSSFCVTRAKTAKTVLNQAELSQSIKTFDGDYDPEYKDIKIPFMGIFAIHLNLEKIDHRFIETYGLDVEQAREELRNVGQGTLAMSQTYFAHHLSDLFAKAQSKIGQNGEVLSYSPYSHE